jgi:hypothetical protein
MVWDKDIEEEKKMIKDKWQPDPEGEPREFFLTSYHHFREVMCSTEYTIEQKDNAYGALLTDYARCKILKQDEVTMQSITMEWERRRVYEVLMPIRRKQNEYTYDMAK